MRSFLIWNTLAAFLALLTPPAAGAPIAVTWVDPFRPPVRRTGEVGKPFDRLHIGALWAQWDVPTIRQYDTLVSWDPEPSFVLTAEYFVTRRLALGGFWNPYHGQMRQSERLDDFPQAPDAFASFEADFWEIHATYFLARGWSVQLGFSGNSYNVELVQSLKEKGYPDVADTFHSPSIWITKSQRIAGGETGRHPVDLYGSLGYYTSSQYSRSSNFILGGSVGLTREISLSGSIWLYDLDEIQTRVTLGLTGRL